MVVRRIDKELQAIGLIPRPINHEPDIKRVTNPIEEYWPPEQSAPNPLAEALGPLSNISAADAQELDAALSPQAAIAADMVMRALREARCSCPTNHDRVVETHATDCWRPFLDAMIRKSDRGEKR